MHTSDTTADPLTDSQPTPPAAGSDASGDRVNHLRQVALRVTAFNMAVALWVVWHNWATVQAGVRVGLALGVAACVACVAVARADARRRMAGADRDRRPVAAARCARLLTCAVFVPQLALMTAAAVAVVL